MSRYPKIEATWLDKTISYLYNQDKITHIASDGNIYSQDIEKNQKFYRPKTEKLFELPLLVIHKKIGYENLPIGIKKNNIGNWFFY